jgi:hypothetical protein
MVTIVIADLHHRTDWVEPALVKLKGKYKYDEVVFLGDYFDNFHDTVAMAEKTAKWLRASLEHPDRIHLLGNHDMPYMVSMNDSQWCPGFSHPKCKAINEVMRAHWDKLKASYYTQGFLLSHAGFVHKSLSEATAEECVTLAEKELSEVKRHQAPPLFLPGARLGERTIGGITWADWDIEFIPLPKLKQIVGHTPNNKVRTKKSGGNLNHCMDTNNQHVCIIQDGKPKFILRSTLDD